MRFLPSLTALGLVVSHVLAAVAAPSIHSLSKRCTNSASDRSCWGDYSLSTNYYNEVPDTGITREVKTSLRN